MTVAKSNFSGSLTGILMAMLLEQQAKLGDVESLMSKVSLKTMQHLAQCHSKAYETQISAAGTKCWGTFSGAATNLLGLGTALYLGKDPSLFLKVAGGLSAVPTTVFNAKAERQNALAQLHQSQAQTTQSALSSVEKGKDSVNKQRDAFLKTMAQVSSVAAKAA